MQVILKVIFWMQIATSPQKDPTLKKGHIMVNPGEWAMFQDTRPMRY